MILDDLLLSRPRSLVLLESVVELALMHQLCHLDLPLLLIQLPDLLFDVSLLI
jgi:hypothetical protein